jgi:hypothetical protein
MQCRYRGGSKICQVVLETVDYPLPKMEHILQRMIGSYRMSMIDGIFLDTSISMYFLNIERKQPSLLLGAHSCMIKCPSD